MTKNFFGLQSLDKQFDDGFFDYLDNLVNFFAGFIRYSLNRRFDPGFFDSFGGFISYSLDSRFDDGFFDFFDNLANFFGDFVEYSSFFACLFEMSLTKNFSFSTSTSTSECFIGSSSLTAPY